MAALRRRPARVARLMGLRRKMAENWSGVIAAICPRVSDRMAFRGAKGVPGMVLRSGIFPDRFDERVLSDETLSEAMLSDETESSGGMAYRRLWGQTCRQVSQP